MRFCKLGIDDVTSAALSNYAIQTRPETNNELVYRENLRAAMTTLSAMPRTVIGIAVNLDYTQLSKFVDKFG